MQHRDQVRRIRVVGAGVMGAGIARLAARSGVAVELADRDPAAPVAALGRIEEQLARDTARGRTSVEDAEATRARLSVAPDPLAPSDADLIVEAVREDLEVKRTLLRGLEGICPPDTLLATNTSSLSVTAIGAALSDPGRLAGLHFFNPAPVMRVVEVVPGIRTAEPVVRTLVEFVRRTGHEPVRVRDVPGFVVNHAGRGLVTEALQVVDDGIAEPADVDRIARDVLGLRMGPFELLDLTGLDVSHPVLEGIWSGFYADARLRPSPTTRVRAAAGLLGRKTGEGFYRYAEGVRVEIDEPVPPAPDGTVVWTDDEMLRSALDTAGIPLDTGARPGPGAAVLLAPLGASAAATGTARGIELSQVVGVDPLSAGGPRVVLAVHPGTDPAIGRGAVAAVAATGRSVTVVRDAPAGVAQRLLAAVVNTAAGIAQRRIASPADIDTAVRLGLGYPRGPLAWGEHVGAERVLATLRGQLDELGDPRYRPSAWITDRVRAGVALTATGTGPAELSTRAEAHA